MTNLTLMNTLKQNSAFPAGESSRKKILIVKIKMIFSTAFAAARDGVTKSAFTKSYVAKSDSKYCL